MFLPREIIGSILAERLLREQAPREVLSKLVADYAQARVLLKYYTDCQFPPGTVVQITDVHNMICNWGIVTLDRDIPSPEFVAVRFENYNVWFKPVTLCFPVSNPRYWPRSIRRMKLRAKGYKFFPIGQPLPLP